MDYKDVIESRYNRQNWLLLLRDIFGNKAKFWSTPYVVDNNSQMAKQALWLGTISLSDEQTIAIYEVELTDKVDIERNRRGIRDMLLTQWRNNGNAGAFMFCYRENESVLRFSYVSESWKFDDDGTYQKESTDTKRFTYLLGEGHRSRTAIQQFETLKGSAQTLKDLTKAFSVDAVSDMFFRDYKAQYANIIFYITGKRMVKKGNKWEEVKEGNACRKILDEFSNFADPEKAVRDYVKKLMGRLVFLQFLQKKGWLGVPLNEDWGNGDHEFIQNLFANTKDKDNFVDGVLEVLFDDLNTERKDDISQLSIFNYQLRIPYLNGGLFERDATDETNFPLPAKYMESMLDFFSQYNFTIDENDPNDAEVGVDPEMLGRIFENLLEDNKDKGAFYTPKEIVQYMCRESLIAYLQTDQNEEYKESIRKFVTTHNAELLGSIKLEIDQKLKDVKICDPAIGSGAFPMGLLKELYLCRSAIEGLDDDNASEIKKHIIQHNIYGVDIEKGAVDIARLRFWLSLIVDERTPHALPNLDFKIMQGNSLLEQYKGIDLSTVTEKKRVGTLDMYDDIVDVLRLDLRNLLAKYYDCTDHKEKKKLRKEITDNVKQQLLEQGITINFGDLDLAGNDQFFLWHTWFHDVFSQGGFDIVIGNPPYVAVRSGNISEYCKDLYKRIYKSATGQFDLYALFIEFGMKILKDNGVSVMITESTFLSNKDFSSLRKLLIQDNTIRKLLYLGENVFDTANVDVSISLIQRGKIKDSVIEVCKSYSEFQNCSFYNINQEIFNDEASKYEIKLRGGIEGIIIYEKIKNGCYQLGDLVEMPRGAEFGSNAEFILETPRKNYERIIVGKDIFRYGIKESHRYIFFDENNVSVFKERRFYKSPKLFVQRIRNLTLPDRIVATYDDSGLICTNTLRMMVAKKDSHCDLKVILGIINSKLINYVFRTLFLNKDIYKHQLERIPIPQSIKVQQQMVDLVDSILREEKNNQMVCTSEIEAKIDLLVYHLYNLTYDEVLIVDPETPITREEYENYNAK